MPQDSNAAMGGREQECSAILGNICGCITWQCQLSVDVLHMHLQMRQTAVCGCVRRVSVNALGLIQAAVCGRVDLTRGPSADVLGGCLRLQMCQVAVCGCLRQPSTDVLGGCLRTRQVWIDWYSLGQVGLDLIILDQRYIRLPQMRVTINTSPSFCFLYPIPFCLFWLHLFPSYLFLALQVLPNFKICFQ